MESYLGDIGIVFASLLIWLYMSWDKMFRE